MNISRNEILRWSGWWWTEVFKVRHACSYDFYNAWQSSSSFRFRFYTSSLFQFFDLLCNFCFSLILIWAFNALTSAESFLLPLFFTGAGKLGLDACMQLWIFVSKIFSAMTMAMSIYRTLCVLVSSGLDSLSGTFLVLYSKVIATLLITNVSWNKMFVNVRKILWL